jgi:LPXTG-motif cell wall-anchored protein
VVPTTNEVSAMNRVMTLLATTVLLIALLAGTAMAQSSASASASALAAASATASASVPATAQYDQYATATPTAGVTELPATGGGAGVLALLAGVLLVGGGLVVARKL